MTGRLYGLGVGPGDPELLTLKALRILRAAPVIAYPASDSGPSIARRIVEAHLPGGQEEIEILVPMRVDRAPAREVYDAAAGRISACLEAGRDVAVLCEGDPFFYGSFMYLFERLAAHHPVEIVPGVSSINAAAALALRPLVARNDVLTVIPAPLGDEAIEALLERAEGFVIMKLGRHMARIRALLARLGLEANATYVERATQAGERLSPLSDAPAETPYFSLILGYRGAEPALLGLARQMEGAR
ncbi:MULTISPECIES: precorrin-2 C(20)-methyltransferase [unclassified Aureimonas]|uniref:precorrin-2 C(20)-methyltransferase n=1 Tax=unclassified Aureimonas TaxID=2615206 RepID=UPI0006F20C95|nr:MULTISPECIES: precorrin-2 C(20)-methyltransferase [unclassified Aureimonas]KQT64114.1 precorrin-2 C(20)-methyltransferase [Aureimonas sp. Leaf427]KQT81303.1 precorrin-2 C(20)-methyltransferase [Aureimonas sp. Leaf460]